VPRVLFGGRGEKVGEFCHRWLRGQDSTARNCTTWWNVLIVRTELRGDGHGATSRGTIELDAT